MLAAIPGAARPRPPVPNGNDNGAFRANSRRCQGAEGERPVDGEAFTKFAQARPVAALLALGTLGESW